MDTRLPHGRLQFPHRDLRRRGDPRVPARRAPGTTPTCGSRSGGSRPGRRFGGWRGRRGCRIGTWGIAGQKDRHATTRQFLSVPGLAPEAALAFVFEPRSAGERAGGGCLRVRRRSGTGTSSGWGTSRAIGSRWCSSRWSGAEAGAARGAAGRAGAAGCAEPVWRAALRGRGGQRRGGARHPAGRAARARPPQAAVPAVGPAVGGVQPRARAAGGQRRPAEAARGGCPAEAGQRRAVHHRRSAARRAAGRGRRGGPHRPDARQPRARAARGDARPAASRTRPWRWWASAARSWRRPGRDLPGARRAVVAPVTLGDPPRRPNRPTASASASPSPPASTRQWSSRSLA